MQVFNVEGMTCGHCVRAVTQAVQSKDPAASVNLEFRLAAEPGASKATSETFEFREGNRPGAQIERGLIGEIGAGNGEGRNLREGGVGIVGWHRILLVDGRDLGLKRARCGRVGWRRPGKP